MDSELKRFEGLPALMVALPTLEPDSEWIYVNPSAWDSNPLTVDYYFIPEQWVWNLPEDEVFIDDEELEMPGEVGQVQNASVHVGTDAYRSHKGRLTSTPGPLFAGD